MKRVIEIPAVKMPFLKLTFDDICVEGTIDGWYIDIGGDAATMFASFKQYHGIRIGNKPTPALASILEAFRLAGRPVLSYTLYTSSRPVCATHAIRDGCLYKPTDDWSVPGGVFGEISPADPIEQIAPIDPRYRQEYDDRVALRDGTNPELAAEMAKFMAWANNGADDLT
ncbi:hypothetical protein HYS28_00215 [Candidatus Uhrbacteria bacterium]|nr:hypothetical protein [Candidatus Uhrbacteria bacterium]